MFDSGEELPSVHSGATLTSSMLRSCNSFKFNLGTDAGLDRSFVGSAFVAGETVGGRTLGSGVDWVDC